MAINITWKTAFKVILFRIVAVQVLISYFVFISAIDLALLSQADHSIMSYGTFGLWGALLAGDGEVLLPKSHRKADVSQLIEAGQMDRFKFI